MARRLADPLYRMCHNISVLARQALRGCLKSGRTIKNIGCSPKHLFDYLESQFTEGMNWKNLGQLNSKDSTKWHIDHIIPRSVFRGLLHLLSQEDRKALVRVLFNWRNLQPMWGLDNISKGAKPCARSLKKLIALLEATPSDCSEADRTIVSTLMTMAKSLLES
jgi:hypothetical protein